MPHKMHMKIIYEPIKKKGETKIELQLQMGGGGYNFLKKDLSVL